MSSSAWYNAGRAVERFACILASQSLQKQYKMYEVTKSTEHRFATQCRWTKLLARVTAIRAGSDTVNSPALRVPPRGNAKDVSPGYKNTAVINRAVNWLESRQLHFLKQKCRLTVWKCPKVGSRSSLDVRRGALIHYNPAGSNKMSSSNSWCSRDGWKLK